MAALALPATDSTSPGFARAGKMGAPESPNWHLRNEGGSGNLGAQGAYLDVREGSAAPDTWRRFRQKRGVFLELVHSRESRGFIYGEWGGARLLWLAQNCVRSHFPERAGFLTPSPE